MDMERREDLRDLWEKESMGMRDMRDREGKMMLLLGDCGANDARF